MGRISRRLAERVRKAQKSLGTLRRQAQQDFAQVPKDVKDIQTLVESGHDPLHAAYIAVQNFTSFFAESVSTFDELDPYYRFVTAAEDEYMPGGPPISPLTNSYFTTWAFFDGWFGPDKETIGTCLLDVADLMEMDPCMVESVRLFQETRMGVFEHRGVRNGRCLLRELVTDDEFSCHVSSGYQGKKGELWYVRLCPPIHDFFDYHVVFTTPYVLLDATKSDWIAYLKKSLLGTGTQRADTREALYEFMKSGKGLNHWNEFIFLAYHHHQHEAIFLAGLPDVKGSLPHAT